MKATIEKIQIFAPIPSALPTDLPHNNFEKYHTLSEIEHSLKKNSRLIYKDIVDLINALARLKASFFLITAVYRKFFTLRLKECIEMFNAYLQAALAYGHFELASKVSHSILPLANGVTIACYIRAKTMLKQFHQAREIYYFYCLSYPNSATLHASYLETAAQNEDYALVNSLYEKHKSLNDLELDTTFILASSLCDRFDFLQLTQVYEELLKIHEKKDSHMLTNLHEAYIEATLRHCQQTHNPQPLASLSEQLKKTHITTSTINAMLRSLGKISGFAQAEYFYSHFKSKPQISTRTQSAYTRVIGDSAKARALLKDNISRARAQPARYNYIISDCIDILMSCGEYEEAKKLFSQELKPVSSKNNVYELYDLSQHQTYLTLDYIFEPRQERETSDIALIIGNGRDDMTRDKVQAVVINYCENHNIPYEVEVDDYLIVKSKKYCQFQWTKYPLEHAKEYAKEDADALFTDMLNEMFVYEDSIYIKCAADANAKEKLKIQLAQYQKQFRLRWHTLAIDEHNIFYCKKLSVPIRQKALEIHPREENLGAGIKRAATE